jgi:hypothetical protein
MRCAMCGRDDGGAWIRLEWRHGSTNELVVPGLNACGTGCARKALTELRRAAQYDGPFELVQPE